MQCRILLYSYTLVISLQEILAYVNMKPALDKVPISKRFLVEGFVPNVIPYAPNQTAMMSFPYGGRVVPGVLLTYLECKCKPKGRWRAPNDATYYTLIALSPDIPSDELMNTRYGEYHPWIVRNIPGLKLSQGEELRPWNIPSVPRRPNELFYVIFLIYQQDGFIHGEMGYAQDEELIERGKFRVRMYTELQNLSETPHAGNYFLLSYDPLRVEGPNEGIRLPRNYDDLIM